MPYKENLKKASELKMELDGFRPLTPEMENRIMQKFQLDWNYHSSHIEGNQLTYGETRALILFGHTAQAKPLKDHLEMTGHNEAIKYIEEIIKQERPLTETFIRELHQLILKEPYEGRAITPDGKRTRKTISIGQYKTGPNHVKTKTGEIFYFASPEETPAKMDDLMQWYNNNIGITDVHPVLIATEFHYRFIRIHPFDDGNGRIARLLMNFILMQKGFPPAIIKTEDKNNYIAALQQADAGQIEYFFNYVCDQVNHSLELMIKGAKGQSIEELDDLDKELALLKYELNQIDTSVVEKVKSPESIKEVLEKDIINLITACQEKILKFKDFYKEYSESYTLILKGKQFKFDSLEALRSGLYFNINQDPHNIIIILNLKYFIKSPEEEKNDIVKIIIVFQPLTFKLNLEDQPLQERKYNQHFINQEIIKFTDSFAKNRLQKIKQFIEELKNKK